MIDTASTLPISARWSCERLGAMHLGGAAGARRIGVDHRDQPRTGMRRIVPRMVRAEIAETDDADLDWLSRLRHALLPHRESLSDESVPDLRQGLPKGG